MPDQEQEQAKAALIEAHAEVLRHVPTWDGRCGRCQVSLPCPPVLARVDVMEQHGHLVDADERKRVETGEHECGAWIWPYQY